MKRYCKLAETLQRRRGQLLARATRRALGLSVSGRLLPKRGRVKANRNRRGSTLLVVMALLGMLLLLGMVYFTFATQEQQNATNFAEAAKKVTDSGDDIDAIFDAAIKQLIQGSDQTQKNSPLSYRHSLLGTLLGVDQREYSGSGVNVVAQTVPGGFTLIVDQNRDGTNDGYTPGYNLLEPNDSPAVSRTGVPQLFERNQLSMPAPDVDYTYPDINNMFLGHKGVTWDFSTTPPTSVTVIKPSFHRPELLRDPATGQPMANWQSAAGLEGRLFRPHPNHLYVWRQNTNNPPEKRFLSSSNVADAAIIASLPGSSGGFPFNVDRDADGNFNEQGVWSRGTGIPNNQADSFDYDADTDNDGIYDSIWMDLDLPMLVRSTDNAKYVPLVAMQVLDLDGLLNLNIHGNLSGDTQSVNSTTVNFGSGSDISRSSMGLGPNEVNLLWGLDAMPGVDVLAPNLADHTSYFGHTPVNSLELGNMELWWLLTGRVQYSTPRQIIAGRFGEADRLWRVLTTAGGAAAITVNQTTGDYFPHAGITWGDEQAVPHTGGDDNNDANEGGQSWQGGTMTGQPQRFVHPLALGGSGKFWGDPLAPLVAKPKQLRLTQAVATYPNQWIKYDSAGVGYDDSTNNQTASALWMQYFGGSLLPTSAPGALMSNPRYGANYFDPTATGADNRLYHDTLEVTLEPKFLQRPIDEPLETLDTLLLQMTSGDRNRTGISSSLSSRITSLMPGNMTPLTGYQVLTGQRFTTDSWDPKTFALPRYLGSTGADGQPGKAGTDDNGDGVIDDQGELGWPGTDDDRAWEFNVDYDGDGLLEFPPQFNPNAANGYQPDSSRPENAYGANDPFRPQLRRLLYSEFGNTSDLRQPMRLSVNEFLDVERRPGTPGDPHTSPLQYRSLTPHSQDVTLTTVPSASPLPNFPPTTEAEKEFWARRDRQQMARDIYVLLYTFCGGNDSMNVTTTSGTTVYPHGIMQRHMAQFAVNLVDALDRDSVITAFEYDRDLSNGWGLDDDFTTTADGGADRDVVYGVEAQELTFSEVLWAWQNSQVADHPLTPFNETAGENNFLQIELRCVSPTPLDLYKPQSTSIPTGVWRIHRDDINNRDANRNSIVDATENAVTFVKGTYIPGGPSVPPDPTTLLPLQPGALFTIASADISPVGSASLYVDSAASSGFEAVAPNKAGAYTSPLTTTLVFADLDLNHASHSSFVKQSNGAAPSDLLSRNNNPGSSSPGATTIRSLNLDRRLNPYLVKLTLGQNPFHTVDQYRNVPRQALGITPAMTTQAMVAAQLATLSSSERSQPLHGNGVNNSTSVGPSALPNTLAGLNSNSPAKFHLFESHFDRDFGSTIELFHIPLRGPAAHTRNVVNSRRPSSLAPNLGQLENGGPSTFGGAVLMQIEDINHNGTMETEDANNNGILDAGEDGTNGLPVNNILDIEDVNNSGSLDSHPNHFHRLLSMVEVPTRTHRQLGDPLKIGRVPGKINLNNVRDPRVLGALIDDRDVIGQPEHGAAAINTGLADQTGEAARDWWYQFLVARDGQTLVDPTSAPGATNPYMPPLPISGVSRPFRDLGVLRSPQSNQSVIQDTILRTLPSQVGLISPISPSGRGLFDLANEAEFTGDQIDPYIRQRLLSKIFGNTTTRSNVFVVFATIGMFECYEIPLPNPGAGAVRIGGPLKDLPPALPTPIQYRTAFIIDRSQAMQAYDQGSGTFDWKKLIKARQRIN